MGRKNNRMESALADVVRWREGGHWLHGRLVDGVIGRDETVWVIDARNGDVQSLHVFRLERQTTGPRGGKRWKPYMTAEVAMALTAPAPKRARSARQLTGQMDMFGGDAA